MSLADDARAAVRRTPFLLEALRAGVVNYAAAARMLDLGQDTETVATALRRYAESLPEARSEERSATVTMRSGLEAVESGELLRVGDTGFAAGDGSLTGVLARGDIDAVALGHVLARCRTAAIDVEAAGTANGALVVVVQRRDGPDALRVVESALEAVPVPGT